MKATRLIVPGAVLGVVALLGYGLLRPAGDPPNMLLGKAAPDFTLRDTSGRAQTLSAYRGQPVVVNFWASWCEPCRQEAPMFSKVSQELSGKVPFLGLLYNDQPALADTFSQQYGLTYPTVLDPGSRTAIKYGIGQVPVTYIVDTKGTIVYHHLGPVLDEAEFRAALQKAGARL